jgi:hypothetical protein
MNVLALGRRSNHAADVLPVFDGGISLGEILKGDFVPDRNVVLDQELEIAVILGHDAKQLRACFDAFDHYHADIVAFIVHQELWNTHRPSFRIPVVVFPGGLLSSEPEGVLGRDDALF